MERMIRNYDEGEVLRDLAQAGTKIKIITAAEAIEIAANFNVNTDIIQGKKLIVISKKNPLGIKRLGKVDFLLNSCQNYVGVTIGK